MPSSSTCSCLVAHWYLALLWCPYSNQNFKSNPNPIQNGSKVTGWIGYTIHPIQYLPLACTQWLRVRRPNISQTSFLTLHHGRSQLRCAACCRLQTERRNGRTTAVPKTWTLRLSFYPPIDHDSNSKNSNLAPVNISAFSPSSAEQIRHESPLPGVWVF